MWWDFARNPYRSRWPLFIAPWRKHDRAFPTGWVRQKNPLIYKSFLPRQGSGAARQEWEKSMSMALPLIRETKTHCVFNGKTILMNLSLFHRWTAANVFVCRSKYRTRLASNNLNVEQNQYWLEIRSLCFGLRKKWNLKRRSAGKHCGLAQTLGTLFTVINFKDALGASPAIGS